MRERNGETLEGKKIEEKSEGKERMQRVKKESEGKECKAGREEKAKRGEQEGGANA